LLVSADSTGADSALDFDSDHGVTRGNAVEGTDLSGATSVVESPAAFLGTSEMSDGRAVLYFGAAIALESAYFLVAGLSELVRKGGCPQPPAQTAPARKIIAIRRLLRTVSLTFAALRRGRAECRRDSSL